VLCGPKTHDMILPVLLGHSHVFNLSVLSNKSLRLPRIFLILPLDLQQIFHPSLDCYDSALQTALNSFQIIPPLLYSCSLLLAINYPRLHRILHIFLVHLLLYCTTVLLRPINPVLAVNCACFNSSRERKRGERVSHVMANDIEYASIVICAAYTARF
jgi:hypothetical protein